jgi:hypothetical protein
VNVPTTGDYGQPIFSPPPPMISTDNSNKAPYPQARELSGQSAGPIYEAGAANRIELDAASRRT